MFVTNDNIPIKFLACWHFKQTNVNQQMYPRKFSTIAFRNATGDGVIDYEGRSLPLDTNMVTLVPQNIGYTRKAKFDDFFAINFEAYNYNSAKILTVKPADPEKLVSLFSKTSKAFRNPSPGYLYRCTAYLCEILELLQIEFGNTNTKIPDKLTEAINYLNSNYTNPNLKISDLCAIAHISEVYFRTLFEKALGVNPKSYIIRLRLERAVRLLETTSLSINDVSAKSGFSDSRYFATQFKNHYGMSPSVARRKDKLYNLTINKSE